MPKIDLETLQRADHDALIRVESKLDNLATDVKIMGDGFGKTVADHEIRIKRIEDVIVQTNLLESYKEFRILQQKVHDFMTSANVYRVIAGFLGGGIVFLATQLPNWIRLLWQ